MKRIAIAVTALVALVGCASGLNRPVKEVVAVTSSDQVQHVKVTAHSFYFDPNRIVVRRGVPVELNVSNSALFVPHDFSCESPEGGIEVDGSLGMFHGSKTLHFTPTQVGEYPFWCHVDGHAKKGMRGTIVVVEK